MRITETAAILPIVKAFMVATNIFEVKRLLDLRFGVGCVLLSRVKAICCSARDS